MKVYVREEGDEWEEEELWEEEDEEWEYFEEDEEEW